MEEKLNNIENENEILNTEKDEQLKRKLYIIIS